MTKKEELRDLIIKRLDRIYRNPIVSTVLDSIKSELEQATKEVVLLAAIKED